MDSLKKIFWSGTVMMLSLPLYVSAQPVNNGGQPVDNTVSCPIGQICNPLKASSLFNFLKDVLDGVLRFGTIIVVLAIIYSGFLFIKAQGNEEELKKAKDTFTYVIIGAAVILGSWVLAQIVDVTIKGISGS